MNKWDINRLVLGTAQFGLSYGLAAGHTQVPADEVNLILEKAHEAGIERLDTAASYGVSECVLGKTDLISIFKTTTKTLPIRERVIDESHMIKIQNGFHQSLLKLKSNQIDTLLVHDVQDLLAEGGEVLWSWMEHIKDNGTVSRIGVSVYDSHSAKVVYENFKFDVVQIPYNVFDQRIENEGFIDFCVSNSIAMQVRSVFLQGIVLMNPNNIPSHLSGFLPYLNKMEQICMDADLTAQELSLAFVARRPEIENIIIGVHDLNQLDMLINAWKKIQSSHYHIDWNYIQCPEVNLIDPRMWIL